MKYKLIFCLVVVAIGYVFITMNDYSWTHPWKTPVQVLQNWLNILRLDFDNERRN